MARLFDGYDKLSITEKNRHLSKLHPPCQFFIGRKNGQVFTAEYYKGRSFKAKPLPKKDAGLSALLSW